MTACVRSADSPELSGALRMGSFWRKRRVRLLRQERVKLQRVIALLQEVLRQHESKLQKVNERIAEAQKETQ